MRRLARRNHGESELAQKMARAGYDEAQIAETLDFLRARRYLDDAAFALGVARASADRRRWGPARIEKKLRELNLPAPDIAAALDEVFPDGEAEAARRALEKFLAKPRRERGERLRVKAYRHLCARGFSAGIAYRLVSTVFFEDTEDSEDS